MLKYRNLIIFLVLLSYSVLGSYLSISNGVSHDQLHEQMNWKINFDAIKGLIYNNGDYKVLINYLDKYHGIAFHYFSQPIQLLTHDIIGKINQVNDVTAYYLSRHLAVFIIFSISGIFFYLLSFKLADDKNFSLMSSFKK